MIIPLFNWLIKKIKIKLFEYKTIHLFKHPEKLIKQSTTINRDFPEKIKKYMEQFKWNDFYAIKPIKIGNKWYCFKMMQRRKTAMLANIPVTIIMESGWKYRLKPKYDFNKENTIEL